MSRLSQYFAYINAKETPSAMDVKFLYTDLTITQELRDARYLHRLEINKDGKQTKAINREHTDKKPRALLRQRYEW